MGLTVAAQDPSLAALLKDAAEAYRDALATQVEGGDPTEAWERWTADTAALLLASWAAGALSTVRAAGMQPGLATAGVQPTAFARSIPEQVYRFEAGPAAQVVARFISLLPLTRERWEALIDYAYQSAGEMSQDEAASALAKILDRSPRLAEVVRGGVQVAAPGVKPPRTPEVERRRTPAVQAAVQGSFFATGMTQRQVEQTRDLLAKVIRQEVTTSVAGKQLERLGVGDFVEQATLETGTDLTAARLETIYRTNLNRAQTQGQLDIVRDKTVQAFVPLMRFSATKDRRTRDTHRAMDGYVATVEQIDAMGIPAPLGFNCRCAWIPIPVERAVREGLCDEDGNPDYEAIKRKNGTRQRLIDSGAIPDPGFVSG